MKLSSSNELSNFGLSLTTQEKSGLENAFLQREIEEKLPGNLKFWGKVSGGENDYLVAFCVIPQFGFPSKKFYYWFVTLI